MHSLPFSRFSSRALAIGLVCSLVLQAASLLLSVPYAWANPAAQGDFVLTDTGNSSDLPRGIKDQLGLNVALPPADSDTFLDGDGSATTGAGAQEAIAATASLPKLALPGGEALCGNTDGTTAPTNIVHDADGNCAGGVGARTVILGADSSATNNLAAASSRIGFRDTSSNGTWGSGEDLYFDADVSLHYNAQPLNAITVVNAGTAGVSDIVRVGLWTENSGNSALDSGDLQLDSNCGWDGNSWVCDGSGTGLVLYSGLGVPRIYATYDIATSSATAGNTVQLRIPQLVDGNANSDFDAGDEGVIFSFDTPNNGLHDGPPTSPLTNSSVRTIASDILGGGSTTTSPQASELPPPPPVEGPISSDGSVDSTLINTDGFSVTLEIPEGGAEPAESGEITLGFIADTQEVKPHLPPSSLLTDPFQIEWNIPIQSGEISVDASNAGVGLGNAQVIAVFDTGTGQVSAPVDGVVINTDADTITFSPFQPFNEQAGPCVVINNPCAEGTTTSPNQPTADSVNIEDALRPLEGNLIRAFHFDAATEQWQFYDPRPIFVDVNTLRWITPGQIYWIRLERDQVIGPSEYQLYKGWNIVPGEILLKAEFSAGQTNKVYASMSAPMGVGDGRIRSVRFALVQSLQFAVVLPQDVTPPRSPSGVLSRSVGGKGILLTWNEPPDTDYHHSTAYRSEKDGELGNVVGMQLKNGAFFDDKASSGETYFYTVESVDASGNRARAAQVAAQFTQDAAAQSENVRVPSPADAEDGDLMRVEGDTKIYVVRKRSGFTIIRHFVDAVVPTLYGHLGMNFRDTIRPVDGLGAARPAAWVRCGDCSGLDSIRVWEVNADGTRHWMNMTWGEFVVHTGNDPSFAQAAIFEINSRELAHYAVGPDVRFRTP